MQLLATLGLLPTLYNEAEFSLPLSTVQHCFSGPLVLIWRGCPLNEHRGFHKLLHTALAVPYLHKEVSGEAQVAMFSVQRISQLLVALLQANTRQ
jgi:hypothetical protein